MLAIELIGKLEAQVKIHGADLEVRVYDPLGSFTKIEEVATVKDKIYLVPDTRNYA